MILRILSTVGRQIARSGTRSAWAGLAVVALVIGAAALSPLGGYPIGADVDPSALSRPPGAAHWLGTDHLGRDVAWRSLLAARAFVGPGLLSVLICVGAGVPAGAVIGWLGGVTSAAGSAALSSVASLPRLVLVLLIGCIYGSGPTELAIASGLASIPALAEAIRDRIERLRTEEFVLASQAHGLGDGRILVVHLLLAACARTIARHATEAFGAFVVLECTLSYLGGFGVREPYPSWGNMLAFEWGEPVGTSVIVPALCIWATVGATSLAATLFAEVEDG